MLQQTQIAAVIPYYERWMSRFPTLKSVAEADDGEILSYWQGLGYYRRCKFLVDGIRQVQRSGMPSTLEDWLQVKGVGRYTAGAIASISQGVAAPIVDGNVIRVYSRLLDDGAAFDQLEKNAWKWAEREVPIEYPGDWNQALMELGQLVCSPQSPKCDQCPVVDFCESNRKGTQSLRPALKPRKQKKRLQWTVHVHRDNDKVGLRKATSEEWWSDLFVLPYAVEEENEFELESPDAKIKFTVTHHEISARIVIEPSAPENLTYFNKEELKSLPIPAPFRKILNRI